MQPLGRKPIRFPCKEDCHPPKGYVNWWETDFESGKSKKSDRQRAKQEIRKEIDEL